MKNNRVGDYYTPTITVSKSDNTYMSFKPIKLDSIKIDKSYVKVSRGINSNSKAVQFPLYEKLANGKHRFFYKHGMLVDRLTNYATYDLLRSSSRAIYKYC